MMKTHIRYLWIVCLMIAVAALGFTASGCSGSNETRMASNADFSDKYSKDDTWVIHWYLCGTDLETNYGAATNDFSELLDVELPPNVKVLIQTGGAKEWQNSTVPSGKTARYLYDSDGLHELEKIQNADMGTPKTLADFLRYGQENYPADHHVFVFWDHGGGSAAGVCYDEQTGHMLSLNDIRQAFESVCQASTDNPPFEIIGFDACLMATYDTANTLSGLARYMVASEEVEPGNGWYYTGWVGALAQNPAMGGAGLGKTICDSYMKGCEDADTDDAATLSVIDMARLPALRDAYEAFGVEALQKAAEHPKKFFSAFGRQAKAAENYGGNTRDQGYSDMVDLADLAKGSGELLPKTSTKLVKAIEEAVIYSVHGFYRDQGSGLSGFYSYDNDEDSFKSYAAQKAAPLSHKCLYHYLIYGELPKEADALIKGQSPSGTEAIAPPAPGTPSRKIFDVTSLEDLQPDIDSDGNAFIRLTEDQMDMLSSIHCNLIYMGMKEDILLYLGSDSDIDANWETGLFKDNFRAVWPMLDGHPVYIEITAEEDGYNLYSIPIKLNGMECNLQVSYDFKDEAYHILGARKGIDSNGMGDRNLIKLKKGDRITTIHYAMTISGDDEDFQPVEVDTFTIGNHPVLKEEQVGDGLYGYLFEFITPGGDSALSTVVQFTVEGENITTSVD